MMFKCTDCGLEFEIKPDYCDCGNNVFEEIKPQVEVKAKEVVEAEPKNHTIEQNINQDKYHYSNNTFSNKKNKTTDLPSVLIFIFCIILSILSWIFIGKDSVKQTEEAPKKEIQAPQNIPSIDKLWKENTVKQNPVKIQSEPDLPKMEEVIKQIMPVYVPQKQNTIKTNPQKTTKPTTTVKNTVKTSNPATQSLIKQTQTKATVTQSKPTTPSQIQQAQKKQQTVVQNQSKPQTQVQSTVTQTELKQQSQVQQKQQVQQKTIVQPSQNVSNTLLQQELANYKVALRNKIGSSINFLSVTGNGNCAITFKIDSAGNLINRKFVIQSDNNSLNNAVYKAMMSIPTFKAPPAGYQNETMTLSVKMNNGNYNVYLK